MTTVSEIVFKAYVKANMPALVGNVNGSSPSLRCSLDAAKRAGCQANKALRTLFHGKPGLDIWPDSDRLAMLDLAIYGLLPTCMSQTA